MRTPLSVWCRDHYEFKCNMISAGIRTLRERCYFKFHPQIFCTTIFFCKEAIIRGRALLLRKTTLLIGHVGPVGASNLWGPLLCMLQIIHVITTKIIHWWLNGYRLRNVLNDNNVFLEWPWLTRRSGDLLKTTSQIWAILP